MNYSVTVFNEVKTIFLESDELEGFISLLLSATNENENGVFSIKVYRDRWSPIALDTSKYQFAKIDDFSESIGTQLRNLTSSKGYWITIQDPERKDYAPMYVFQFPSEAEQALFWNGMNKAAELFSKTVWDFGYIWEEIFP
jgi:hypothetical protein